jgi:hypothetical protein
MSRRVLSWAVNLLLLVSVMNLAGCRVYVPTGIETLERPDRVRVYLSEPGEFELLDLTANNVTMVDGEVVRWDDEALVLSVWWLEAANGLEFRALGETITVQREHISRLERRKISVGKTVGLVAVVVVAFAVGVGAVAGIAGGGSGSGDSDPQN